MGRRRGRSGHLPRWWRGKKVLDDVGGEEIYTHDGSLFKQRGLNVSRQNYDSLTDEERENEIQK